MEDIAPRLDRVDLKSPAEPRRMCCPLFENSLEQLIAELKALKQIIQAWTPKQLQNDSFRPMLVKNRFLGTPHKSKLFHQ